MVPFTFINENIIPGVGQELKYIPRSFLCVL